MPSRKIFKVTADYAGINKLIKIIKTPRGLKPMHNQAGERYLGFIRTRFVKFSRGGGDWPKLKRKRPNKGRSRNKRLVKKKRKAAILRDTGLLFSTLTRGNPGNMFNFIKGGVRVGINKKASAKHRGGKRGIGQIAYWHQVGAGNLPKREIIVPPDARTAKTIQGYYKKGMNRIFWKFRGTRK